MVGIARLTYQAKTSATAIWAAKTAKWEAIAAEYRRAEEQAIVGGRSAPSKCAPGGDELMLISRIYQGYIKDRSRRYQKSLYL